MADELRIRNAGRGDLAVIVRLYADDALGEGREDPREPPAPEYTRALEVILSDARQELVVVELDGAIVGTMQLTLVPGLTRRGTSRMQLESVRVDRAVRSQGIGARMLAHAIARARARGCRLIELTSDRRRPRAHEFYLEQGFEASHVGMKLALEPEAGPAPPPGRAVRYRAYDAFAARRHEGNAAAVVAADELDEADMQLVARELRAPTTAFVRATGDGRAEVHFFTPTSEIALCGHASLAAAAFLADEGLWPGDWSTGELATPGGRVGVSRADGRTWLGMPLPSEPSAGPEPGRVVEALGLDGARLDAETPPALVAGGLRHLFVAAVSANDLIALAPAPEKVATFASEVGFDTLGVFVRVADEVFLRDFTAAIGDDEETASGTTSSALATLLWRRGLLREDGARASVAVVQGPGSRRPGRLACELRLEGGELREVRVGGAALPAGHGVTWLEDRRSIGPRSSAPSPNHCDNR